MGAHVPRAGDGYYVVNTYVLWYNIDVEKDLLQSLVSASLSTREISTCMGVSHVTVIRYMKKFGLVSLRKRDAKTQKFCIVCNSPTKTGKFCSVRCSSKESFDIYIERWKNNEVSGGSGENISLRVRKYLFSECQYRCPKCGWDKVNPYTMKVPLTIHHINNNPADHSYGNLEVLCPNCHSLTENFGSRNRGSGRRHRKDS